MRLKLSPDYDIFLILILLCCLSFASSPLSAVQVVKVSRCSIYREEVSPTRGLELFRIPYRNPAGFRYIQNCCWSGQGTPYSTWCPLVWHTTQ